MPSVGQSLFLPCPLGTGCLSHFPASFLHVFFWIIRFSHTIRSKIGQVVNCFYFSHNLRSSIFSIITHEPKQSTAQFYLPGAKTMPIDLPPSAVQVVFYFDLKTSLPTYNHGQSLRFAWFVLPYTETQQNNILISQYSKIAATTLQSLNYGFISAESCRMLLLLLDWPPAGKCIFVWAWAALTGLSHK